VAEQPPHNRNGMSNPHRDPSSYPPLPPPPAPQLPDFKPAGMSVLDKTLAWIMGFIVLAFVIVLAAHYLLKPASVTHVAKPAHTVSAAVHAEPKPKAVAPCSSKS
jgi:hypothetical protein